jgi:hypothetical protein
MQPKPTSGQTIITAEQRMAQYAADEEAGELAEQQLDNVVAKADFGVEPVPSPESPPIVETSPPTVPEQPVAAEPPVEPIERLTPRQEVVSSAVGN